MVMNRYVNYPCKKKENHAIEMLCQLSDENKRERVEGLGTDNMYQGSRHDAYS